MWKGCERSWFLWTTKIKDKRSNDKKERSRGNICSPGEGHGGADEHGGDDLGLERKVHDVAV
mgnify:CR=1 FL=1